MRIYRCIEEAIKQGLLAEPFNASEAHNAIKKLKAKCSYPLKTLQNFLPKHRKGNPSKTIELFERLQTKPAKYKLS